MGRQDMIDLIEAWTSFRLLDDDLMVICDGGINPERYERLYNLYNIIKRNTKYSGADDESSTLFEEILYDEELDAEEKYMRLTS